jgi:hypothetical protein
MHFRFTIRDLLWLTALVALAAGWWSAHRQFSEQQRHLAQLVSRVN